MLAPDDQDTTGGPRIAVGGPYIADAVGAGADVKIAIPSLPSSPRCKVTVSTLYC